MLKAIEIISVICFIINSVKFVSTVWISFENLFKINPDGVTSKYLLIGAFIRHFSMSLNSFTLIVNVNATSSNGHIMFAPEDMTLKIIALVKSSGLFINDLDACLIQVMK